MPLFYLPRWSVKSKSFRSIQSGHMSPNWPFDAVMLPGSITPIFQFAPAGSMYSIVTPHPIHVQYPSQNETTINHLKSEVSLVSK